jgi:hypothetical protein
VEADQEGAKYPYKWYKVSPPFSNIWRVMRAPDDANTITNKMTDGWKGISADITPAGSYVTPEGLGARRTRTSSSPATTLSRTSRPKSKSLSRFLSANAVSRSLCPSHVHHYCHCLSVASNSTGVGCLAYSRRRVCDNLLEQVMPRAKARALPASKGFSAGPARLNPPNRPPQPTNPIFDPEGCKAYIVYVCTIPPCTPPHARSHASAGLCSAA